MTACPGADDLSVVGLDPPNVLENVDATVALTGAGAGFVHFVAVGGECCIGATSAGPTQGGEVSSDGTLLTPINLPAGYYKACIKLGGEFPFSDNDYTALDTPLKVTVTRPPPPPPFSPPPSPPLPPPPAPPPCTPPFAPPGAPPEIPPLFGVQVEEARCIVEMGDTCITFDTLITVVIAGVMLIFVCAVAKPLMRCITKNRITPGCVPPPLPVSPAPQRALPPMPPLCPSRASLSASSRSPYARPPTRWRPAPIAHAWRRRGRMVRVLTRPAWLAGRSPG
jgi:hypothetical protein